MIDSLIDWYSANGNDTRGSTVGGWEHSRVPSIEYIRRMRDERYGPSVTAGQISTQLVGGVDICNRHIDDDIKYDTFHISSISPPHPTLTIVMMRVQTKSGSISCVCY